ncbi:MAG: hypothetical protein ACXWYS_07655, partial [Gaiellaceae bacterium]
MRRSFVLLLLLALVAGLGLAACGGGESEAEKEAEAAAKEAGSEITCEGTAMTGDPGLPPVFPKPSGVTYVKSTQTGPTRVVLAYYDGDLDGAYEAYKDEFASAGYDIPFDEKEEDDAEVSYQDADG